ncbi:MAG TPA: hypothetical protein VJU82_18835 [Acidobacteriaceae bacterium]|nr:hypothetical protein [Acidobacteriaceae bacterium]
MGGLSDYYITSRRRMLWFWGVLSVLALIFWTAHVLPFSYGSVVSRGVVVARSDCSSKGSFSYTYSYVVDGQAYTAKSKWGGLDGNWPCQKIVPGVEIPITYRADDPSRSMGSTIRACLKTLAIVLAFMTVICVTVPFFSYLRQPRENR